uniref:b(0,+)-type amino acid transporter 1 n=1 Tax=Ciona intestinalis TaxID=7719 RepID=F6WN12_CIOIN
MGADTGIRQRKKLGSIAGSDDKNVVELKKEVGIIGAISMVVGTMIGSGIFLSPAGILAKAESVGASLCVWAGCGILATLSALSYVELGLLIRKSGGEYQYLKTAFGNVAGFLVIWTSVIVTKPSSFAIISIGFAEYVTAPFYPGCTPPATIQKCAAAFCILLITSINCINVKLANFVQIFFTAAKLLIIVAIIIGGFVMMARPGGTDNLVNAFEGSATSFSAIAVAFYGGQHNRGNTKPTEVINISTYTPYKNFPLALMIGIPLVTVCYVLVNIAYFTVMTPSEMLTSNAVAITFGDRVFGAASFVVPVAVACSTFGAANGSAFTAGRITYAAGRNGHMLQIFSYISVTKLTPSPALIFNSFIALIMIIPDASSFSTLIDYFTFASWIFYGASFLSLIVLRYRKPNWERPYKVFILVPVICFIASLYLIVAPIIDEPQLAYLYAAIFILAGLLFYFPLVHFKKVPAFMEPLSSFLQQVLEVVPPPDED